MAQRGGGRSNAAESGGHLTEQQQLFAVHFAAFANATHAAIRAGYAHKSAGHSGWELSHNPAVLRLVNQIQAAQAEAVAASPDRTVAEIARIAYADVTQVAQVLDGYAFISDTWRLPAHLRAAVASIHQAKDGLRIRMHDKVPALRLLAEIQNLLKPQGPPIVPVLVQINGVLLDAPGDREPEAKAVEYSNTPNDGQTPGGIILPHNPDAKIQATSNPGPTIEPPPAALARIEAARAAKPRRRFLPDGSFIDEPAT